MRAFAGFFRVMGVLAALLAGRCLAAEWGVVWQFNQLEKDQTTGTRGPYQALAAGPRSTRLCVVLPHRKDDYWRAVDAGVREAAKQLGVKVDLYYGGGYDDLPRQRRLLRERCLIGNYHAAVIGAVSETGLEEELAALAAAGKPVVDLVNGMQSRHLAAKSLVSFHDMGARAAAYINAQCVAGQARKVAWFPGPQGAGWVREGDAGFRATLDPACAEIVTAAFGDTGLRVQQALVEEALAAHPDLDLLVGTAVTADIAAKVLTDRQQRRPQVMAYYLNASVWRGLKTGQILAAPTDLPLLQAKIAVDLATRIVEGQPYSKRVSPEIQLFETGRLDKRQAALALAAPDLQP